MTKEQKGILTKFIIWGTILILICIIGISKVLAEEVNVGYVTNKTTIYYENNNAQAMVSLPVQTNVNMYLYNLLSINLSNQNIIANNTYLLEISTPNAKLQNINEVHIVDSSSNVCQFYGTSDFSIGYAKVYFKCNQATNNLTITLNNTNPSTLTSSITTGNNFQWNYSYLRYYTEDDDIDLGPVISNQTQNTQNIINNNSQNTQNIINNNSQNTQSIISNNNTNTDKIIEENKKNFNDCRDSVNLFNEKNLYSGYYDASTLQLVSNDAYKTIIIDNLEQGTYTIHIDMSNLTILRYAIGNSNTNLFYNANTYTITTNSSGKFMLSFRKQDSTNFTSNPKVQVEKGNTFTTYEPYGEICINKLDEQNKTSKGILGKLGDLLSYINPFSENFFVYKLIELLGDLLKNLFVPSSTFIKNWYDDFKGWFELKLGFLATPFTLFIDFIETFLNLEESNLIINIPQITVPNFENYVIIQAQTFNWGELLNSKQEFRTLWELYLDFIDVFLILNFLGLCETKYNRIFGGDTTPYEYYTTEETYNINDETGEATNHMLRQRTTRREKVK